MKSRGQRSTRDSQPGVSLWQLPFSTKILFTLFLLLIGIGYTMSIVYLLLAEVTPHQKMGMDAVQGVVHKYYGKRDATKLQSSLRGEMGDFITPAERGTIAKWVSGGATRKGYASVEPILARNCLACHGEGGQTPRLTTYEDVIVLTKADLGESIRRLAAVSHVHLFGMAIIFVLTGLIFSLCELREGIKAVVVSTPFLAMLLDIGSWWLTHYETIFAYTVIAGGVLLSAAVPIQICVPVYQMWSRQRGRPQNDAGLPREV